MSDTNDTVDGLLAEFRGYSAGMPPSYHVTMSWHDFRVMLNRLEAAHRRELAAGGNAAKLREALEHCRNCAQMIPSFVQASRPERSSLNAAANYANLILRDVAAALSAPPRNCDRFASAEEAWDAYDEWVESYRSKGQTPPFNEFGWLFAHATEKEGGAK